MEKTKMSDICIVSSLSEYIAAIEKNDLYNCISRGENQLYEFPMRSSIHRRNVSNYPKLLEEYHHEVETTINPSQENHFLAFSQHHGIPTNLLDFSYSPLVSLYFCVDGCRDNGYVYFIKKSKMVNMNKVLLTKPLGWGMFGDLLMFDLKFYNEISEQMGAAFILNREEMVSFFEEHAERFIEYFEKTRGLISNEEDGNGISDFKKALLKYKENKIKWNRKRAEDGRNEPATLQIYSSYTELMNAMLKIFKGDIFYPKSLVNNLYKNQTNSHKSMYSANIEIMLCLLKMEQILYLNLTDLSDYELEFPFYFSYRPPIIDDRVRNQSSVFIFQPFAVALYSNLTPVHVWQKIVPDFVIEIQDPEKIKKELDAIGINSKYIYYDYDHVARYISNMNCL